MAFKIPTGFNARGRREFQKWVKEICGYHPTPRQCQAWFDTNEYKDFKTGRHLYIEASWTETISGNPARFDITPDMLEFVDAI